MKRYDFLNMDFDSFRRWFNQMFSLSLNGKFCGLLRLGDYLPLFRYKLTRLFNHTNRQRPLREIIVFRCGKFTVKLYSR